MVSIPLLLRFLYEQYELGALSTLALQRIVLDASHIDEKKRSLLAFNQMNQDLMELLHLPKLKERYGKEEGIDLIFF
jgi:protein CMS1